MPNIVMSYRRADSMAMAGRIRDRLAARFGESNVFMDLDSIPVGTDFRTHIQQALAACDVMLVIVGPNWRGTNAAGKARLMEEHDPVRIEVESALRQNVRVIPVLLDDAEMPEPSQLPEAISGFSYLNAAHVDSGRDFGVHVDRLIRAVERIAPKAPDRAAAWRPGRPFVLGGLLAIALLALGAVWLFLRPGEEAAVVAGPDKSSPAVDAPADPPVKEEPQPASDPPAPPVVTVPTRIATGAENPPMPGYAVEQLGDWQLACPQSSGDGQTCLARQNFIRREQADGQLALSIIAAWGTDGMRVLLVSIPVNAVDTAKGLDYQLPGGAPANAALAQPNCLELACMVDIRLTGTTWVALDTARTFDLAYTDRSGARVLATVSLRGFKDAFARLSLMPGRVD